MSKNTPEKSETQDKIINYFNDLILKGHPLMYFHRVAGGPTYIKGSCDLYCVYDGLHIEIECKRLNGGIVSIDQEKWAFKCKKCGIPYLLVNDFNKFKESFDKLLNII